MANINNKGRWAVGQKSSSKHVRAAASAPPVKRDRRGRTADTTPDENGFKLGTEVIQPGEVGAGVIIDIRKSEDGEPSYGVRSPGGSTAYYAASELS